MRNTGTFLYPVILVFMGLALISCSGENGKEFKGATEISLIFSSDLRGNIRSCGCAEQDMGGLGRMATYVKGVKAEPGNTIYVTSGDNFSSDFSFTRDMADLVMESFQFMGLDLYTPGEYEFVFGLDYLKGIQSTYSFDFIAANLVNSSDGQPVFSPVYVVREMDTGLKVAITGVLDDGIVFPGYIDNSGFRLEPEEEALRKVVPRMREEADLLVLICHMGIEDAKKLLGSVDAFNVAVLGHERPKLDKVVTVGKTVLLGAGGQGKYMGRLNCLIDRNGELEQSTVKLIPLSGDIEIHSGVRQLFDSYGIELTDKEARKKVRGY
ncbi:MAG: hypothetical protein R6U43_01445 [Candidatus Krumholzibacteriales bacterium]